MRTHIVWKLTAEEKAVALAEGERRQRVNVAQGRIGRNRGPASGQDALRIHQLGAGGEMAAASFLGLKHHLFQESDARRGSYDLPPNIDVKTRSNHDYDLICFRDESPEKTLVLVTIQRQEIRLHGWIDASSAKREEWWRERVKNRGCYYVPQAYLRPMDGLLNNAQLLRLRETCSKA